jgi:hypothetical protein
MGLRKHGVGEKANSSKLTNKNARYILNNKTLSIAQLAEKFNVAYGTIYSIQTGRSWKFLGGAK